jgi:dienelactone hydrolase
MILRRFMKHVTDQSWFAVGLDVLVIFGFLIAMVSSAKGADNPLRQRIIENHIKYIPAGQGHFATIIAIPGCSGISSADLAAEKANPNLDEADLLFRRHYRHRAEAFRNEGFVVLLIDIYLAEGLLTACGNKIDSERIADYINAAIAWAQELPVVDAGNINLVGWSMGGWGVLTWLHGPRSQENAVRSAITVYPDCDGRKALTNTTPHLMLLGDADDIALPAMCEALVARSPTRQNIRLEQYPGARHGFDVSDAPPVLNIGNGLTAGYSKSAAEASWQDILAFLTEHKE